MTTAKDVYDKVGSFFGLHGLNWENLCGVCTDGAPAMLGCRSGFQQRVKLMSPKMIGVHCMIHRQVLASKTLPPDLNMILKAVVRAVNYIKTNALYTRLFANSARKWIQTMKYY